MEPRLVEVEGILVEEDALRIAQRVNEYDSNLSVEYLERADRLDQPPFRVVERCKDGVKRVVFTAWKLDNRILERIFAADTHIRNVNEESIVSNEKIRASLERRYEDMRAEQAAMTAAILRSPKSKYSVKVGDKLVTFGD